MSEAPAVYQAAEPRPLADILADLRRPVPPRFLASKKMGGQAITFIPWYRVTRLLDHYAPGWSYAVDRFYSAGDRLFLSVTLTIRGADGAISRAATGSEELRTTSYGDPSSNAESMALRRAAAKFGLGARLYEKEDIGDVDSPGRVDSPPPRRQEQRPARPAPAPARQQAPPSTAPPAPAPAPPRSDHQGPYGAFPHDLLRRRLKDWGFGTGPKDVAEGQAFACRLANQHAQAVGKLSYAAAEEALRRMGIAENYLKVCGAPLAPESLHDLAIAVLRGTTPLTDDGLTNTVDAFLEGGGVQNG